MVDTDVAGKTVIVGLGNTGLSCARFLAQRGEPFVVVDTRQNPPALTQLLNLVPDVDCYLGGLEPFVFEQADRIIVSPGISANELVIAKARLNGAEIIGDIALFAQYADAPIVAITGSNGKSTVTTLLAEMAQQAGVYVEVGGNLGTPALDLLSRPLTSKPSTMMHNTSVINNKPAKPAFYIVELSSFQLETTPNLNAQVAVVLNISADHMDRYVNLLEYRAAKRNIYNGCKIMIVNRDDPEVMEMLHDVTNSDNHLSHGCGSADTGNPNKAMLSFGLSLCSDANFGIQNKHGRQYLMKGEQYLMPTDELHFPGWHNLANALAALALGDAMRLPLSAMLAALREYSGLPHRTQWVATIRGVSWYNDSKGTNVGATVAAITGMPGTKILIAGGDGKGADFKPLREAVIANNVRLVVLIGKDAQAIAEVLFGVVQVELTTTLDAAVRLAGELSMPGESVILSPACASFDMFKDYQHRGDTFVRAVKGIQS
ncbi:MAG: UDP-N-acetylmuramoyl-L-alanine--D-glutamate ligase [Gammaproteobacteria bacterium]|nr:UDP-N-acetylmuramoyl-L-alanine--D-glutamate ligase [Gammaproteobacteria bacterium]